MTFHQPSHSLARRGALLAIALVSLLVASLLGLALVKSLVIRRQQARVLEYRQQCLWLADSALQRAVQRLAKSPDYTGETWHVPADVWGGSETGTATIKVQKTTTPQPGQRIEVEARYPDDPLLRIVFQRGLFLNLPSPGDSP